MGLKHKAIHAMLANPHLAPFEMVDRPTRRQDWIVIDHLMTIYRVKESDLVENEPRVSILNMARTLASCYVLESKFAHGIVLVKDGAKAHKPSVRDTRLKHVHAPHIDFCKRNLCAIEYAMMYILADMGMKDNFFLVVGSKMQIENENEPCHGADNLITFHRTYLEDQEKEQECLRIETTESDVESVNVNELSDVDPEYANGSIDRPAGTNGVFLATFADPADSRVTLLRNACTMCRSTEADLLTVELANILKGEVTVSTGDSDVVAVLTACGRRGLTLRMDNKSYPIDRDMHMSSFGELVFSCPNSSICPHPMFVSSEGRFRVLSDITGDDEYMFSAHRTRHLDFENFINAHSFDTEDVSRGMYAHGIRGSVYSVLLHWFSEGSTEDRLSTLKIITSKGSVSSKRVVQILEMLYPNNEDTEAQPHEAVNKRNKRKVVCLDDTLSLDKDANPGFVKDKKRLIHGLKGLSVSYMNGTVPLGSYGRFARLSRSGRYVYLRMKEQVLDSGRLKMEMLLFMILCGTDYNFVPYGLGIKRLLIGAVTNYESYSSWCSTVSSALRDGTEEDCLELGTRLATFTKVPEAITLQHWTRDRCNVMFLTMKYVLDLWTLKTPKPGPGYGFSVQDGAVRFAFQQN